MTLFSLGVIVHLREGPEIALRKVRDLGFSTCQLQCWDPTLLTDAMATAVQAAATAYQVEITTIWAGLPGRTVWDFIEGPVTIGLVPEATRSERIQALKLSSDFARRLNVPSITTHVGFIPECPTDPTYPALIETLREIAEYCRQNGQEFWFETGQETPITLLRTIDDIGTGNLGINLDPANLLLYGKANPVDALDVFGRYVRGVHAKDGEYPTNGRQLGQEKPLGVGRVNFPAFIAKLKTYGYTGALTIEREITGDQQVADIKAGKQFLEDILASLA